MKSKAVKINEKQYQAIKKFRKAFQKKFGYVIEIKSIVERAVKRELRIKAKELNLDIEKDKEKKE